MAFRILSLDGGGAWALIEARALIALYSTGTTGHQVLNDFDLVAANSGGSIVLAGLVANKRLGEVLALFENQANRLAVFSPTQSVGDRVLREWTGIGPKYSAKQKLPALRQLLGATGDQPLSQVAAGVTGFGGKPVHLVIVGFDYDRNRATFFRSAEVDGGYGYGAAATVSLAEAVHASTNAPVDYFDAPAILPGVTDRFWDGGLTGNNNPVLAACVEAVTLGVAPGDVRVLSIGTATVQLPLADPGAPRSVFLAPRPESTLVNDLRKLATAILDDPPDFATFTAHALTGGGAGLPAGVASRITRLNPLISPVMTATGWAARGGWTPERFGQLCELDIDAIAAGDVACISDWCGLWLADVALNQPIRRDGSTLVEEVGYGTFSAAAAGWQTLKNLA